MTDSQSGLFPRLIQVPKQAVYILHGLLTRVFPPSPNLKRTENIYLETLGLAGLFLYLATFTFFSGIHENGETMIIIAFLLAWKSWKKILVRQPLFWLLLAFALSLAISTLIGMNNFPESNHLREAKQNIRLGLFIPLAWWIGANINSIRNAFIIVCLGFIFSAMPWMVDWSVLGPALEGSRPRGLGLGVGGPRPYSVWIGFLLMGVGVLGKDLLPDRMKSRRMLFMGAIILFFVFSSLLVILLLFQGRASIIAVMATLFMGLVIRHLLKKDRVLSLKKIVLPLGTLAIISVFLIAKMDFIVDQFEREIPNIKRLISGNIEELEKGSLSERVQLGRWVFVNDLGITFFGWGPRSAQAISRDNELREKYGWDSKHMHLHSDYLAVLFRQGLFGCLVLALTLSFFIFQLYIGFRDRHIPAGFYAFFLMSALYVFIVAVSNITLRIDGFLGLVAGLMFAAILNSPKPCQHGSVDKRTSGGIPQL